MTPPAVPTSWWRRLIEAFAPPGPAPESPPLSETADRARLSFLLQQQEAELQKLKAVLSGAQGALKKAEEERQKWSDTLSEREVYLEKEVARSAASGQVIKHLDDELKKLRRDKLAQQRTYEDRVHGLIERLGDLRASGAFAAVPAAGETSKTWLLEKQSYQEEIELSRDKVMLIEDKFEKERADRLETEKRFVTLKETILDLQEKLRNAESALWQERTRAADLEKARDLQRQRSAEFQQEAERLRHENTTQEPQGVSEEVIRLRERVHELETLLGSGLPLPEGAASSAAEDLVVSMRDERDRLRQAMELELAKAGMERERLFAQAEEHRRRADQEAKLRLSIEDRAAAAAQELERTREDHRSARAEWDGERRDLLAQWDKEKDFREQDIKAYRLSEERAAKLSRELTGLRLAMERDRAAWEEDRRRLSAEAASARGAGAERPAPPAPSEDAERLLREIDGLLAENAALSDEVRFLRGEMGGP